MRGCRAVQTALRARVSGRGASQDVALRGVPDVAPACAVAPVLRNKEEGDKLFH